MKPTVVFVTGITGTGKTTVCQKMVELFSEKAHEPAIVVNDYLILWEWMKQHMGEEEKVTPLPLKNGEINGLINPYVYRELSLDLANGIVEEIRTNQSQASIALVESARGAGAPGVTDFYGEYHFKPIMSALGDQYQYCNIELRVEPVVGDFSVLKRRVDTHLHHDVTAAPWVVCQKYIRADGLPIRSHEDAERLGIPSYVISNHIEGQAGLPPEVVTQLAGIVDHVLLLATEAATSI